MRLITHIFLFSLLGVTGKSLNRMCVDGVYLKSLVYVSPTEWVIMLDDKKYTPDRRPKNLKIIKLVPTQVYFQKDQDMFGLAPGQSYDYFRKKKILGKCKPAS